ncbi:hypothetical protein LV832_17895 [[Clostridium] innocuum]|uniref:hypothetical protein n=1 Tax=Clostridium innocuum TaxID=1522 RepID=UPI001F56F14E|nr:hypothetical protein [[Clostridium] innocuum]MCI2989274.1 hypothetical protein [[Clostridium] innocuum]
MSFIRFKKFISDLIRKDIFWIFIINLILLIQCLILNTPYNETNDDTGMRALASGAYGDSGGYLVFINIIIGKGLTFLYNVFPSINWYTLFEIAVVITSFILLGFLLIDKIGKKYGLPAYVLLIGMFYSEFLSILQFTRISILIGIIGYLYIFHYLLYKKKKWYMYIGFICVWMCLLIRQSSFNIVTLYAAMIGFCILILNKDLNFSKFKNYVFCFTVLFTVSIAFIAIDTVAYAFDSEWKDYKEFTKLRSKLADYGFPSYEENKEIYERMGITRNDFQLYDSGILLYDDTLSVDCMKELARVKDKEQVIIGKRDLFITMFNTIIVDSYFVIYLGGAILFFLINKRSSFWILFIGNFIAYISLFIYFYYIGRIVTRVMVPTTFMFIVTSIFCYDKKYIKNIHIPKVVCITSILVFFIGFHAYFEKSLTLAKYNEIEANQLFNTMKDKSKIYFADFSSYRFNYKYFDAYHEFGKDYFSNQINTGGWLSRTPTINRGMDKLGITNLSALLTKKNTYLYTGYNEDLYRNFLETHYTNERVSYSIINLLDSFKIVKYTTPLNSIKTVDFFTSELINYESFNDEYDYITIRIKTNTDLTGKRGYLHYIDQENERSFVIEGEYIENGKEEFEMKAIIPNIDVNREGNFYPVIEMNDEEFVTSNKEVLTK